jgi:hypothetical protein
MLTQSWRYKYPVAKIIQPQILYEDVSKSFRTKS